MRPIIKTSLQFALMVVILAGLAKAILKPKTVYGTGPWYVATGGIDSNDCFSSTTPCASINGAIEKANLGDTILVATGIYTSSSGSGVVSVNKSLTLSGGWNAEFIQQDGMSTVDGGGMLRGVIVSSGITATLERFVIQHGRADGGAGLYNGGVLTLTTCTIRDNSNPSFNGYGGGIWNSGLLTLWGSAVTNNTAYGAGGIVNYGSLTLNNSTISANAAHFGGGVVNASSGAVAFFYNSTVSANRASTGGGFAANYSTSNFYIRNTILAGNSAITSYTADCHSTVSSLGHSVIGNTDGCSYSAGQGDLADIDPKLGTLIGSPGYHPLLSDSPAIDAGNPAGCTDNLDNPLVTDQRGVTRAGRCDMGAYEYTIPGPPATIYAWSGTPQNAFVFTQFPLPLQALVLDDLGSPVTSITVTFTAPIVGASGTFTNSGTFSTTATTDRNGVAAAAAFTANGLAGNYEVTATIDSITPTARFALTNTGMAFLPISLRNYCGSPIVDDFGNPASGWPIAETSYWSYGYLNSEYRLFAKDGPAFGAVSRGERSTGHFSVEVDVRQASTANGSLGILFGLNDNWSDFYTFEIYPATQEHAVFHYQNGKWTVLEHVKTSYIQPGQNINSLRLSAFAWSGYEHVSLDVPGYNLNILQLGPFPNLRVGLTATSDEPGFEARFDNYKLILDGCPGNPQMSAQSGILLTTVFEASRGVLPLD